MGTNNRDALIEERSRLIAKAILSDDVADRIANELACTFELVPDTEEYDEVREMMETEVRYLLYTELTPDPPDTVEIPGAHVESVFDMNAMDLIASLIVQSIVEDAIAPIRRPTIKFRFGMEPHEDEDSHDKS